MKKETIIRTIGYGGGILSIIILIFLKSKGINLDMPSNFGFIMLILKLIAVILVFNLGYKNLKSFIQFNKRDEKKSSILIGKLSLTTYFFLAGIANITSTLNTLLFYEYITSFPLELYIPVIWGWILGYGMTLLLIYNFYLYVIPMASSPKKKKNAKILSVILIIIQIIYITYFVIDSIIWISNNETAIGAPQGPFLILDALIIYIFLIIEWVKINRKIDVSFKESVNFIKWKNFRLGIEIGLSAIVLLVLDSFLITIINTWLAPIGWIVTIISYLYLNNSS